MGGFLHSAGIWWLGLIMANDHEIILSRVFSETETKTPARVNLSSLGNVHRVTPCIKQGNPNTPENETSSVQQNHGLVLVLPVMVLWLGVLCCLVSELDLLPG